MSASQGRIIVEQAYAQGKMLDHSGWSLPRGITPSDIDFVVESKGYFLFAEFSRNCGSFECLSKGQSIMYRNLASTSHDNLVVVCKHDVDTNKVIDSRNDVESCTIYLDGGARVLSGGTKQWGLLVDEFTSDPEKTLDVLRTHHDEITGGVMQESPRQSINTVEGVK